MLKIQMALIALLIGCLAFTSCDLIQGLVTPEMPEEMMAAYTSWANVTYAAVAVAAHGQGDRVVYINDVGAMALQDGMTTFPVGTVIVKEIMDATNTSVAVVERMEKTDGYATEDGWLYGTGESQAGCHGCHVKAGGALPGMDAVFTDFSDLGAEEMADMDDMDDMADVDDDMADMADDMADVDEQ